MMKVAIQGALGAFHQQAAYQFFGDDIEAVPYREFSDVFEALMSDKVDRAIVGIENSLYGSINTTYDLLLKHRPVIIGELYLHIQFQLLGTKNSKIDKVTDVYSQVMGLAQVTDYLKKNLSNVTRHEVHDTAAAAQMVSSTNDTSKAAIASEAAGEQYFLKTLASNIEDDKHNYTRFIALSKDKTSNGTPDKTSIILKTDHTPGALYRALGIFAENELNLDKLESRPIPGPTWNYMFYVDYEADLKSEASNKALAKLKAAGNEVKILGSYPKGSLPSQT